MPKRYQTKPPSLTRVLAMAAAASWLAAGPINGNLQTSGWIEIKAQAGVAGEGGLCSGTTMAGSPVLSEIVCGRVTHFRDGQGIDIFHAGEACSIAGRSCAAVSTAVPVGAVRGPIGWTRYEVEVAAVDPAQGYAPAGHAGTVARGPQPLTRSNWIEWQWAPTTGTNTYIVYKRVERRGFRCVGVAATNHWNDMGEDQTCPPWAPLHPPLGPGARTLHTVVSAGAGTSTFTLASRAVTAGRGLLIAHNDAAAVQKVFDKLAPGQSIHFSAGTYEFNLNRLSIATDRISLVGDGWNSRLRWDVTALPDPGGADRGALNIHGTSAAPLNGVSIGNLAFEFGGSRPGGSSEGRRGVNIYNANNAQVTRVSMTGAPGEMLGLSNFGTTGTGCEVRNSRLRNGGQDAINPNSYNCRIIDTAIFDTAQGIEAGRDGISIVNVEIVSTDSWGVDISGVDGYEIADSRLIDTLQNVNNDAGAIFIAAQGTADCSANGTITNNLIAWTVQPATAHSIGFYPALGTCTLGDNRNYIFANDTIVNPYVGIIFGSSLRGRIVNNNIFNASTAGILLQDSVHSRANTISGNTIVRSAAAAIVDVSAASRGNLVTHNITSPPVQPANESRFRNFAVKLRGWFHRRGRSR